MNWNEESENWDKQARYDVLYTVLGDASKKGGGWNEAEFYKTGGKLVEAWSEILPKNVLPFGGERALDFGCGVGRLTEGLTSYFTEVYGLDISGEMINRAILHKRQNPLALGIHYQQSISRGLPLPDSHFDFVCTQFTLQHIAADLQLGYIREFLRVAKPGGAGLFDALEMNPEGNGKPIAYDIALTDGQIAKGQMVCIPRAEVEAVILEAGGLLRLVYPQSAQPFIGWNYLVQKKS